MIGRGWMGWMNVGRVELRLGLSLLTVEGLFWRVICYGRAKGVSGVFAEKKVRLPIDAIVLRVSYMYSQR